MFPKLKVRSLQYFSWNNSFSITIYKKKICALFSGRFYLYELFKLKCNLNICLVKNVFLKKVLNFLDTINFKPLFCNVTHFSFFYWKFLITEKHRRIYIRSHCCRRRAFRWYKLFNKILLISSSIRWVFTPIACFVEHRTHEYHFKHHAVFQNCAGTCRRRYF